MKRIKKFNDYVDESISGTELVGPIGPNYGNTKLHNKTFKLSDSKTIYCNIDDRIYTIDEYDSLYIEYLKLGGTPLFDYSSANIDIIVDKIKNQHHQ